MIKTLAKLFKQEKEKFVVPKGVQDVIPIKAIYDDGIFKVGKDKFSKPNTAHILTKTRLMNMLRTDLSKELILLSMKASD